MLRNAVAGGGSRFDDTTLVGGDGNAMAAAYMRKSSGVRRSKFSC